MDTMKMSVAIEPLGMLSALFISGAYYLFSYHHYCCAY